MLKLIVILFLATGCAQLHHIQLGEIDNRPGLVKKPFDIKVSESGINLYEAAGIVRAFNKRAGKEAGALAGVIGLFQMGPRTGNPVYVKDYAKDLVQIIYEKCPSGRVTGLTSIRESRKYPVVSGEIVKVTGYCLLPKES
jgi:hypothetical protein